MQPTLQQLIEEIKTKKVFRRNKKDVKLKILAALLYLFGLSLRKTSKFLSLFREISHESIRLYFHRIKKVIKFPEKKERKLIAIDETKLKLESEQIFIIWYLWVLNRLGLKYKHETFGCRNAVEGFFSKLKERTKRFHNRFPFNSSFDSVQSWLESFAAFYNYWKWLC